MARKLKSDRILFTAAVLLVCVSVVMVYSASAALALDRYGQAYMFLIRQAMWTALGLRARLVLGADEQPKSRQRNVHGARPRRTCRFDADRLPQLPERHVHLVADRYGVRAARPGAFQRAGE